MTEIFIASSRGSQPIPLAGRLGHSPATSSTYHEGQPDGVGATPSLSPHADLLPLMRGIKGLLDPAGIMNPGKIFEP